MNDKDLIVQYYGSLEQKRVIKLIYKDSRLAYAVLCEKRQRSIPILEMWANTSESPFNCEQIRIIGSYRGFASEISQKDYEQIFFEVVESIRSFMPS